MNEVLSGGFSTVCWASPMMETRFRENSNPGAGWPPGTRPEQLVVPIAVEALSFETVLLYSPRQPETSNASFSLPYWGYRYAPLCQARCGC